MSMDAVCDTLLLEEILPRVAPKSLLRLGATSRRYNGLVRSPEFQRRYWRRAGVFLDLIRNACVSGFLPRFLTGPSSRHAAAPDDLQLGGTNLALFPAGPSAPTTEEASLSSWRAAVVVHSSGGLLLCATRRPTSRDAHYYVCNPVTRQRVLLPELRSSSLCYDPQCALLTVAAGSGTRSQFQVVVIEQWQMDDAYLRLKVFSSGTGQWESRMISLFKPSLPSEHSFRSRPVMGHSGAAYWLQPRHDTAIAYHSASGSFQVIALPRHLASRKQDRVIGERHGGGGGGLRFAQADASVLEVWESPETTTTTRIVRDAWTLLHRVGITDLLERNPEAATHVSRVTPVGFHPTDGDVVFLELPGVPALFAYPMEHGTMNLQWTHNGYGTSVNVFPYVHPPYPVQIPAINSSSSALALPRKRKAEQALDHLGLSRYVQLETHDAPPPCKYSMSSGKATCRDTTNCIVKTNQL